MVKLSNMDFPPESNAKLALEYAKRVLAGEPCSKETFLSCYRALKVKPEPEPISQKWIDYLWPGIAAVSKEQWRTAMASEDKFVSAVYALWGK